MILEQHIRIHTGEPTDLTAEQIEAGEVSLIVVTLHAPQLYLLFLPFIWFTFNRITVTSTHVYYSITTFVLLQISLPLIFHRSCL